ncbi:MAG: hypothetical protein C0483_00950 [Pirellula sp.]|nr:hypothetical protein [Pirellula sp.]
MKSLPDAELLAMTQAALEPYRTHDWSAVQYLWEAVGFGICWDETASDQLVGKRDCHLVLDPNPQNMPARLAVARSAKRDDVPLGYGCTLEEVRELLSQSWVSNADFYVLDAAGIFLGLRSHEDVLSATGMWVPKRQKPN